MTEKQEKILQSALELFAKEGYHATSTSKVAKHAGVSEGLIFRHYANKEGLLQAILDEGERRLKALFADIVMETNPNEVIRKTITMTDHIEPSDYDFWKLQFKLKWELEVSGDEKMEPLKMALTSACSSPDGTNTPASPTISGKEETAVVITGVPHAIASKAGKPKPSYCVG